VDDRARRVERRLEIPALVAALLVIPVIVIEESSFGDPWDTVGVVLNWTTWLVFLAEAVVMLSVVSNRWRWIRAHPIDVAVVVLTPPFFSGLAGVRLLRLLRLLRLVKIAPLARRFFSMEGLRYTTLLAVLTVTAGGAGFAALEGKSTGDGMYWAITTMTTVGYGDLLPTTAAAKLLSVVIMVVGVGFVAVLTGVVAQRFVVPVLQDETEEVEDEVEAASEAILRELREVRTRLADLETAVQRRGG
jgi:voltage-gated potassium channel